MYNSTQLLITLEQMSKDISERIRKISLRLENSPPGSLRINKNRKSYQYYHRINPSDPQGKYIPEKYHYIAVSLAQKDYDKKLIKTLIDQQKAIARFLKDYDPDAIQRVYADLSEPRQKLVSSEYLSDEEFIKQWLNTPYARLGFNKNDPEYYTAKGERVRSKSEILIADALYRHNIPYRYEFPVYQNGVIMSAPDFNCLNVRLRKEYYWEHLGKLGDKEYADRNVRKLEKYSLAGDFDETILILTFETDSRPLNTKVIEEKIRKFLL